MILVLFNNWSVNSCVIKRMISDDHNHCTPYEQRYQILNFASSTFEMMIVILVFIFSCSILKIDFNFILLVKDLLLLIAAILSFELSEEYRILLLDVLCLKFLSF